MEGVRVEVDTVTPPGAMAGGSVTFSDGQNKKWTLDQFGRLGLSGEMKVTNHLMRMLLNFKNS